MVLCAIRAPAWPAGITLAPPQPPPPPRSLPVHTRSVPRPLTSDSSHQLTTPQHNGAAMNIVKPVFSYLQFAVDLVKVDRAWLRALVPLRARGTSSGRSPPPKRNPRAAPPSAASVRLRHHHHHHHHHRAATTPQMAARCVPVWHCAGVQRQ
jgi:hypothetical protein